MKKYVIRLLTMFVTFSVGLSLSHFFYRVDTAPTASTPEWDPVIQRRQRAHEKYDEILAALLPGDGSCADATQLDRYERTEVINALRIAERDASGFRAISISFLLAAVGEDYSHNKAKLVHELKRCFSEPCPYGNNADTVSDYLAELGRRGDRSVFGPLVDVSDKSDGALTASLGDFFSDLLTNDPEQFLLALKPYSHIHQRKVCFLVGLVNGGEMSEETMAEFKRALHRVVAKKRSLANEAKRCMAGIQEANSGWR